MATHHFETCSYSEIGFEGLWRSTFEQPPKKEDADENGYVMAIAGPVTKSNCVGYPYVWHKAAEQKATRAEPRKRKDGMT